jgi:hypothetical protein
MSASAGPLNFSVPKLYRDCLRLADYISIKTGNKEALRTTVASQFRRNAFETDPKKIEEHKAAAVRGLQNYMFHEAQRMAKEEVDKRRPE